MNALGSLRMLALASLVASRSFAQHDNPATLSAPPADSTSAVGDPVEWRSPQYPIHAIESKTQGAVVLRILVAKDGKVNNVRAMSGDPELSDSAAHAVRKWKYVPYFRNGQPEEVETTVTFNFKITDGRPEVSEKFPVTVEPPVYEPSTPGKGITAPKVLYAPDPSYTKAAKKDKLQGIVVCSLVVTPSGMPHDIQITKSLRPDLDTQALEAVRQWRFEPARKDGRAVAVAIKVELQFRLY